LTSNSLNIILLNHINFLIIYKILLTTIHNYPFLARQQHPYNNAGFCASGTAIIGDPENNAITDPAQLLLIIAASNPKLFELLVLKTQGVVERCLENMAENLRLTYNNATSALGDIHQLVGELSGSNNCKLTEFDPDYLTNKFDPEFNYLNHGHSLANKGSSQEAVEAYEQAALALYLKKGPTDSRWTTTDRVEGDPAYKITERFTNAMTQAHVDQRALIAEGGNVAAKQTLAEMAQNAIKRMFFTPSNAVESPQVETKNPQKSL